MRQNLTIRTYPIARDPDWLGRSLDVGEEEGDGANRQLVLTRGVCHQGPPSTAGG